jgi:Ca2+-transporting ATPase
MLKGEVFPVLLIAIMAFAFLQLPGGVRINDFLFIALAFLFTFLAGNLVEKVKVPWVFAALLLGVMLAVWNPFSDITSSDVFLFLANLGMYFLLFVIGFEIDFGEMRSQGKFILGSTFAIILLEAALGTAFVHFVFGYDWFISFIVALSFATVGEAILIPILDQFGIVNTPLGQLLIGIGTLDDIFEVSTLILLVVVVGSQTHTHLDIGLVILSLLSVFVLAYGLTRLRGEGRRFLFMDIETIFLFTLFVLFLFLGLGEYADSAPLAALMAGLALGNFLPKSRLRLIEREVKSLCYGFFAPIFFLWVGLSLDINYLLSAPLMVISVFLLSSGAKMLGSLLVSRGRMDVREGVMLGVGLSVRFSTSIIIIKILFENGIIGTDLYSVIIASSIVFTLLIPLVFSNLISRWGYSGKKKKEVR